MKITEETLKELGFIHEDLGGDPPYHQWARDEVVVWAWNGEYWLVDALDQGGLHVEFRTMEELDLFWRACRLPALLHNASDDQRAQRE